MVEIDLWSILSTSTKSFFCLKFLLWRNRANFCGQAFYFAAFSASASHATGGCSQVQEACRCTAFPGREKTGTRRCDLWPLGGHVQNINKLRKCSYPQKSQLTNYLYLSADHCHNSVDCLYTMTTTINRCIWCIWDVTIFLHYKGYCCDNSLSYVATIMTCTSAIIVYRSYLVADPYLWSV